MQNGPRERVTLSRKEIAGILGTVDVIGRNATADHLRVHKLLIDGIRAGRTTCYAKDAVVLRDRLRVAPPTPQQLYQQMIDKMKRGSARRWAKPEERKKAAVAVHSIHRDRRDRKRARLELLRERAARVIGSPHGAPKKL